jgi:hypothetical protein
MLGRLRCFFGEHDLVQLPAPASLVEWKPSTRERVERIAIEWQQLWTCVQQEGLDRAEEFKLAYDRMSLVMDCIEYDLTIDHVNVCIRDRCGYIEKHARWAFTDANRRIFTATETIKDTRLALARSTTQRKLKELERVARARQKLVGGNLSLVADTGRLSLPQGEATLSLCKEGYDGRSEKEG